MPLRKPSPALSSTDKDLLRLLTDIVVENIDGVQGNREPGKTVLSDRQAEELRHLLGMLIEREHFFRRLAFVNLIVDSSPLDEKIDLKLARLTGKRPIAAGIGMTSENMRKWRVRLGVAAQRQSNDPTPMTFTHFLKMEQKLLDELKVDPRVVELIMNAASQNEDVFRRLLISINERSAAVARPKVARLNDFKEKILRPLSDLHRRDLPTDRLVGLITVISNTSIMFTTRDWGVAGTISTMSGGVTMMMGD